MKFVQHFFSSTHAPHVSGNEPLEPSNFAFHGQLVRHVKRHEHAAEEQERVRVHSRYSNDGRQGMARRLERKFEI